MTFDQEAADAADAHLERILQRSESASVRYAEDRRAEAFAALMADEPTGEQVEASGMAFLRRWAQNEPHLFGLVVDIDERPADPYTEARREGIDPRNAA